MKLSHEDVDVMTKLGVTPKVGDMPLAIAALARHVESLMERVEQLEAGCGSSAPQPVAQRRGLFGLLGKPR